MANTTEMTVTEQLKKVPPAVRPVLQAARAVVRAAAPGAEEIPYGSQPPRSSRYMWKIARYAVDGANVVGIVTFPEHAQALVGHSLPSFHPRLDMPVAVLARLVQQPAGDGHLAAILGKGRGDQVVMSGHHLPALAVDDVVWGRDFAVDAGEGIFAAGLLVAHHVPPGTSRAQVDLTHGHGHASRTPPVLDVPWFGACLEHEGARCVHNRRDHEFPIRRSGHCDNGFTFHCHVFPPWFLAPAGNRRVDLCVSPSARDIVPAIPRSLSAGLLQAGNAASVPAGPGRPGLPGEAP